MKLLKNVKLFLGIIFLWTVCVSVTWGEGILPPNFEKTVQKFEQKDRETPPPADATYFIGSSTFTHWKEISDIFADYRAVNRGFGGSRNFDWIVAAPRLVNPWKPKRIVYWCGCNDIAGGVSVEETYENFKRVIALIREVQPEIEIFVCLPPHPPIQENLWDKFDEYGKLLKEFVDNDPHAFAVEYLSDMCDENGRIRPELYSEDRLHFNADGYKILGAHIRAVLEKESPLP